MSAFGLAAQRAAQEACVNGHPFDTDNTKIRTNGTRCCRQCMRDRARARRAAASADMADRRAALAAEQTAAVTRTCPSCVGEFRVSYRGSNRKYCSRSCAAREHALGRLDAANSNWRGGKTKHPLYDTYMDMIGRCHRPTHHAFDRYGGRGITVCDRWRANFWHFVADMGERPDGHSIDRIDNDGGYRPDNCQWASARQQRRNRRPQRVIAPSDPVTGRFIPAGDVR